MTGDNDVFENTYSHCETEWCITGDSMHNDRCPVCNTEVGPIESLELETGETIVH